MSFRRRVKYLIASPFIMEKLRRTPDRTVLLTFDDGPDPEVTPAVLDRLDRYKARAVFFVVGRRVEQSPWLLKEVLDRGHTLGNHTFRHVNGRQPRFLDYRRDVQRCQQLIRERAGFDPWLFRPPLGTISPSSIIVARTSGMRILSWSVDLQDWRCRRPEEAFSLGEKLAELVGTGDIVLLHDDNPCVLHLLDVFLPLAVERQIELQRGLECLEVMSPRR